MSGGGASPKVPSAKAKTAVGAAAIGGGGALVGFVGGLTAAGSQEVLLEAVRQAGAIGGISVVFLAFAYAVLASKDRASEAALAAAVEERREAGIRHAATVSALVAENTACHRNARADAERNRELMADQIESNAKLAAFMEWLWDKERGQAS